MTFSERNDRVEDVPFRRGDRDHRAKRGLEPAPQAGKAFRSRHGDQHGATDAPPGHEPLGNAALGANRIHEPHIGRLSDQIDGGRRDAVRTCRVWTQRGICQGHRKGCGHACQVRGTPMGLEEGDRLFAAHIRSVLWDGASLRHFRLRQG
jgi:hypothetical protein